MPEKATDPAALQKPVLPVYGLTSVFPKLCKSVRPPHPLELNKQIKALAAQLEAEGVRPWVKWRILSGTVSTGI